MAQSTWSADAYTWTNSGNVWANTTYSDAVSLASDVTHTAAGLTIYPSTATLDTNTVLSGHGGFNLVGNITLGLSGDMSTTNNAVYVEAVTLASNEGLTSIGNKLYVDSITLGTTVNFPLAGTTTWDLDTETWATTTGSWGYAPPIALSVTANMTQTIFSKLSEEDVEKIADATIALQSGATATGNVIIPISATLDMEDLNIKNNINFEESASFSATTGATSINNFLWNDEAEDTGTTWTKVSDPDE